MAEVVLIAGYCGSGKSFQARRQRADVVFDEHFASDDTYFDALVQLLSANIKCAVAETKLCSRGYRAALDRELHSHVQNLTIHWICMENDVAKANKNCVERGDHNGDPQDRVWINTHVLSPIYTYHPDGEVIDIWTMSAVSHWTRR